MQVLRLEDRALGLIQHANNAEMAQRSAEKRIAALQSQLSDQKQEIQKVTIFQPCLSEGHLQNTLHAPAAVKHPFLLSSSSSMPLATKAVVVPST